MPAAEARPCIFPDPGVNNPLRAIGSILNQFLFPAPPPSYSWSSFPGELVCIVGRQGNVVPCTIMPGFGVSNDKSKQDGQLDPASVLVIYCHANGEDIGVLNEAGHWLSDTLGVHVLIPEYPGYGMAPGRYHPSPRLAGRRGSLMPAAVAGETARARMR